ncbi:hypothetical protein [Nostoc sp.]|uniref:hypothetical protein n=1 Tax=Nostoc sp. TaxID=1180 RepID=UPI002FFAEB4B
MKFNPIIRSLRDAQGTRTRSKRTPSPSPDGEATPTETLTRTGKQATRSVSKSCYAKGFTLRYRQSKIQN